MSLKYSSSEGGGDDGPTAGQIPDKAGMTVKGIVKDSAGNGIAGVVVSDGLEVTATDERGIYYLASDLARRNFVFVSVPADCEIPATQGCPRFYRKIDRKQAVNRADFTLTRRKTPSDRHSLIVMADIQLAADNTSVDSYLGHVVPDVLKTVQGLPTEVYGVSLGDLVWNDMSLFPKYRQGLETLGFTTFSLPGNHDHDPAELTDSLALQSYERYFGPANYSVNIGKIHYLFLDNILFDHAPTAEEEYTIGLTDEICRWIEADLRYVPAGSTLVVSSHCPILYHTKNTAARNHRNFQRFLDAISPYKVHAFGGHKHYHDIYRYDDGRKVMHCIARTPGEPLDAAAWHYDAATESVVIDAPAAYHEYTVSFLAYLIWDPVHMYNSVINDWKDVEHQIPFDVRQPKTHAYTLRRLREYLESHPYVNVVRFTTFFHLFTLVFDELRREKYVDWYGYSASVSPYILEQFEKEVGYKFRPEFIIDQGYYNNQYRVPTKEYKDFQAFQRREVAGLMKEMTDIVHEYGKEAMMFLGDHWIGCEPFMPEFQKSGVDAIVGSVGNGSTLRLISDIPGVKYTEGRFLPYFFPDTFHEGGDPVREAKENWVTARRAILRKPIDRIGYGGYLKLACEFPEFLDYVESVCDEFRELYENIKGTTPYCVKTVAVLNSWGQQRAWGCHMVHHALYQKQNYSYAGVIEALSGAPFDVKFVSFDDIKADPNVLDGIDVLINVGDGDTAHTGGKVWEDPEISSAVKGFVHRGGGLIGVGEPGGHQYQGRYLQLAAPLGVEKETGFTLNYDKYNWDEHRDHFILADCPDHDVDFGEGKKSIFALEGTEILIQRDKEVQMAAHEYGKGRGVYISGLPYSFVNNRVLYRAILWAAHDEADLHKWFSTNYNVEVHAYVKNGKYCVVNNTYEPQDTTVYTGDGSCFDLHLDTNEIKWYSIEG